MISHISKGAGFGGACAYVEEKSGAQVIDSNMASDNPSDRAREFQSIASQNPRCTRPVFHASLSAPEGEHLTDDQWRAVGSDYMRGMGFGDSQYVISRHTDTEHDHIHIVANRVKQSDFKVVSDKNDQRKTQTVLREIEQKHGLQVVDKSHGKSDENGQAADLRQHIDASLKASGGDRAKFAESLSQQGITPIFNESSTTGRVSGVSYKTEGGKVIKGRDLGKNYSWPSTEKRLAAEQQHSAGQGKGIDAKAAVSAVKNPMGALKSALTPKPIAAAKRLVRALEM